MTYQPRSYRKFLAASVTATMVATIATTGIPVANAEAAASINNNTSAHFLDVPVGGYAADEIYRLLDAKIISGYSDGTFKPNQSIIRGHAANILVNALDLESPTDAEGFTDLNENSTFLNAAKATKAAGIFTGKNNGTVFGATDQLTREQMATILVRAFDLEEDSSITVPLKDMDRVSAAHKKNVEILYQNGITTGKNDGTFDPKSPVSRAQFSLFLVRAMDAVAPLETSTYEFLYDLPESIVENEDVLVPVTFSTKKLGLNGYENVRFAFKADGPGDVVFKATDSQDNEISQTNDGFWGPEGGFTIDADFTATTDFTLNFSEEGTYTIEFSLVDSDGNVVGEITNSVEVEVLPLPEFSTYAFSFDLPDDIVEGEDVVVPVTFATDQLGLNGLENVRFAFEADGEGDVVFTATDSEDTEISQTNSGFWGPAEGFDIDADYTATTEFTLNFSEAGEYTITFSIVDEDGDIVNEITNSIDITVLPAPLEVSTYEFSFTFPEDVVEGEDVVIPVTFSSADLGLNGLENVRFAFEADGPGDVVFTATDSEDIEISQTNTGFWGPAGGFNVDAEYTATTDFTLNFSEAGDYTITFSIVDADGNVVNDITAAVQVTIVAN